MTDCHWNTGAPGQPPSPASLAREFHTRILELNGQRWFNFEPHLTSLYRALLRPGSVAVDGGANIGVHTLQMALAVSPGGLVVAVEPVPELCGQLEQRRAEHGIPAKLVNLVRCALSDAPGRAEFFQVTDGPQHELSGLKYRHFLEGHSVREIEVSLKTLDQLCLQFPRLDYIKLDLEGAEMAALRGGLEAVKRFRPVISLEQDQYSPSYFGYTWHDLLGYFHSLQYEIYDLFGVLYVDAEMFHHCAVWDFLALPVEYLQREVLINAVRRSMEAAGVRFPPAADTQCSGLWGFSPAADSDPALSARKSDADGQPSATFLVAPWIEEQGVRSWYDDPELAGMLNDSGLRPAAMLDGVLSALSTKPPAGIEIGYTLSINIYDLFTRREDWLFDPTKLQFFIDFMRDARRPVVVNLRANHFVGESPLARELAADEANLARTNRGSVIREVYFNNTTFAPVFSVDERIPVNRFRFGGFRESVAMLARFDRECPNVLRAVTVAGELHHYASNLADPNSAGRFADAEITDYSDASITDFASWLHGRYPSLEDLNHVLATPFDAWAELTPPRVDLTREPGGPPWTHMDSYASGSVPIFGWANLCKDESLEVFLDGERLGAARYHLSRVDVYDALPQLAAGNVGFRFELCYRDCSLGPHVVHVVVCRDNDVRLLLARRVLHVGAAGATGIAHPYPHLDSLPEASGAGLAAYLDHPADGQVLLYNPFAAEWQRFREFQVSNLLTCFTRIAAESGLHPDKIYSHQIASELEGSWNYAAFAVRAEEIAAAGCRPGVNLYGGAVTSPHLKSLLGDGGYGVTEFHPRMGKLQSRSIFRQALEYHLENGAAFLCPYFMGIGRGEGGAPRNQVRDMRIDPLNPVLGSSFFHAALREFLRR